jgi:hypothetical protein
MQLRNELRIACILALLAFLTCGGSDTNQEPQATTADVDEAEASEPAAAPGSEPSAEPGPGEADDAIDPESLSEVGTIEIKQYSVAYIGSGTLGKGTLTYQGQVHPFQIGGLGIGGIGVASIDAHGSVYNLTDLESFTGTYGNARLGATAADKGKGRLWLKNPNGVVIKLWTKMKGLALTGGVDGIVITWESEVGEAIEEVGEETQEALSDAKQETKKAWGSLKDKFD